LEIFYLNSVKSTQHYLKEYIKNNGFSKPIAFVTQNQTDGKGSKFNKWDGKEGNLFFSFVIEIKDLPKDLQIQSSSIYFSYILREILEEFGSNVFIKWPNDFYIDDKKIGGTITTISNNLIYCGIGINLIKVNDCYGFLDINISIEDLLNRYFILLCSYPSWKLIFSKFIVEFKNDYNFTTNIDGKKIILKSDMLQLDGSLNIDGRKVFSLR
jgi:BirA family biotin operon repressor/biotin-[acetyl-CoA-carboxylase] ligase